MTIARSHSNNRVYFRSVCLTGEPSLRAMVADHIATRAGAAGQRKAPAARSRLRRSSIPARRCGPFATLRTSAARPTDDRAGDVGTPDARRS